LYEELRVLKEAGVDITYGQVKCVDDRGQSWIDARPTPIREVDDWLTSITRESLSVHPARFTYPRSLLEDVHWNTAMPVRQDYDFSLQVARRDPSFQPLDRVVYYYRQHQGERVSSDSETETSLRAHLDILVRHVRAMKEKNLGTPERWNAVAAKLWIVGRMIAIYDEEKFEQALELAHWVAPEFLPDRSHKFLQWIDALLSPETTERVILPLRRLKAPL
jgi:hypothetical protein